MQREHFAVNHDVHRRVELEINTANFTHLCKWMLNVRAIVKARQVSDQSDAPDRTPANIFDQAVIGVGCGGDHHGAASELAVVEGEKKARPAVDIRLSIHFQGKRTTAKPRQANEDCGLITRLSPGAEPASAQGRYIGGKANTENVDVTENPIFVSQAKNITSPRTASYQGLHRIVHALVAEIPQE